MIKWIDVLLIMKREEQDKLWAELSQGQKQERRNAYKMLKETATLEDELSKYHLTSYELETLYGKHNLKFALTYEDVAKELFKNGAYSPATNTALFEFSTCSIEEFVLNCTSKMQSKKLLAINKLLNVAKFLNKNEDGSDWVPDFKNKDEKNNKIWSLGIDEDDDIIRAYMMDLYGARSEFVYFRTIELALQAVQILGEDVVRTALTTKY